MKTSLFQLRSADFKQHDSDISHIEFMGPSAMIGKTHITIIAGANGANKSRVMASLVDYICELQEREENREIKRKHRYQSATGLSCVGIKTCGMKSDNREQESVSSPLPSTVLVMSNLVMDRFRFAPHAPGGDMFYQYLGARQATNLMTTGSMSRSVSEAVMWLYNNKKKQDDFRCWLNLVVEKECELALAFGAISLKWVEKHIRGDFLKEKINKNLLKHFPDRSEEKFNEEIIPGLKEVLRLLLEKGEFKQGQVRNTLLPIDRMSIKDLKRLSDLKDSIYIANRLRLFQFPSLCMYRDEEWMEFGQMSSGEQNILATGAKLIAYAKPGSLIAIDEPEVSLNTTWQQNYTDLVRKSLGHASGSHVIIATHSPHLISSLPHGEASVVLLERNGVRIESSTIDAKFEGWGAESVLYKVLDIPSASSYNFQRELASVLKHIQENGRDKSNIDSFLTKAKRLNYEGAEALGAVINSIKAYREGLK